MGTTPTPESEKQKVEDAAKAGLGNVEAEASSVLSRLKTYLGAHPGYLIAFIVGLAVGVVAGRLF